jgi:replicative DNA helicase
MNEPMIKTPPKFPEGERSILGAMLIDKVALASAVASLDASDFYFENHRDIYSTSVELFRQGRPVDLVTVSNARVSAGKFERLGGAEFLTGLVDDRYSTANIGHYIEIVKDRAYQRRLIAACAEACELARSDDTVEQAVEVVNQACLSRLSANGNGLEHIADIHARSIQSLENRVREGTNFGIETGFVELDNWLKGWRTGNLIIICGRPMHGKSAFVEDCAWHISQTKPVQLFSLEMTKEEQWQRFVGKHTGISLRQQASNSLTEYQLDRIQECREEFKRRLLWVEDLGGLTPFDLYARSMAMSTQTGHKARVIIADYLQIMRPSQKQTSREREIGSIATDLKAYAKKLDATIVAICSLSRKPEERPLDDRAPKLSDLRDSGQIEYDADGVIGIYRKNVYTLREEDAQEGEALVLKNRNGPVGRIRLAWEPETATFGNYIERRA